MGVFNKVYATEFIENHIVFHPDYKVKTTDVLEKYRMWCLSKNAIPIPKTRLYKVIKTYEVKRERGAGNYYYFIGMKLR